MKNKQIADLLAEYRRTKKRVKELRSEMIRVAVEELGMEQKEAKDTDLDAFLDGYLVGQGVHQAWRNIG